MKALIGLALISLAFGAAAHSLETFEVANITTIGSKVIELHIDNTDAGIRIVCAVYDKDKLLITSAVDRTDILATKVSLVVPNVRDVEFFRCVKG